MSEPTETKAPATALDLRMKRVEIIGKIERIKADKLLDEIRIERERVDLEQVKRKEAGWSHPVDKLIDAAKAWYIDNDLSYGSEPAVRSLWNDNELAYIKKRILKKLGSL